jgi:3-isopropylmalate dehydrogenase
MTTGGIRARIAVLPGDGVGPEVVGEALRVLRAVAEAFGHELAFEEALVGGAAIDAAGTALPAPTLALARAADAVLFGAVGGPRWDDPLAAVRPEQGLLALRRELGLFANLRPVRVEPALWHASTLKPEVLAGVDLLVVRELTGGLYFGPREEAAGPAGRAVDTMVYERHEVERVARVAAAAARDRRGRLASVDKANVLATSRLWRRVVSEIVRDEFPEVTLEHVLVDAMAMHLVRRPAAFDVIVTENLFGDILTDEASMLAGSLGLLPSASLGAARNALGHPRGLYEPIHGSAPDLAGQGRANPLAAIASAALLLRHSLGLEEEARAVEAAIAGALDAGLRTADLAGPGERAVGTEELGAAVAARV